MSEASSNPFEQFGEWYRQARSAVLHDPSAMTLATVDANGRPSARVVLLKEYSERGFVFYTNYESRKGRELAVNPYAALVFWWPPLEKQVRIEGATERVPREESEAYFRTRPLGSRLGAWASRQSDVLESRELLERRFAELEARAGDDEIELPPFWGGYRLVPGVIEFWQGRPNRLHDRLRYTRGAEGRWRLERLQP